MDDFKIGDLVAYADDTDPDGPLLGTVVEPTAEELAHGKTYEYPVGPEHGDILVDWDDPDEPSLGRAWQRPEDIIKIVVMRG